MSAELDKIDSAYFQSLIGVVRWIVELGRVDICCEVSMVFSYLDLPREGHLQQLYHIFSYLANKHNKEKVFDPSIPNIKESQFEKQDWSNTVYTSEVDGVLKEDLLPNSPSSRVMVL